MYAYQRLHAWLIFASFAGLSNEFHSFLNAGAIVENTKLATASCSADVLNSANLLANTALQIGPAVQFDVPAGLAAVAYPRRQCAFLWNEDIPATSSYDKPYGRFMTESGLAQAIECYYPSLVMEFSLYIHLASLLQTGEARWATTCRFPSRGKPALPTFVAACGTCWYHKSALPASCVGRQGRGGGTLQAPITPHAG